MALAGALSQTMEGYVAGTWAKSTEGTHGDLIGHCRLLMFAVFRV